ncbi:MAG: hypothetical protein RIQ41_155 [Candidatus Parcubacteria bacterium]|jgi:hypothetical protein
MTIPTIDTFEHDIAEEIKTKEATLTDIASATGEVGNLPEQPKRSMNSLWLLLIVAALALIALTGWYFLSTSGPLPKKEVVQQVADSSPQQSGLPLRRISTYLDDAFGGNVKSISQSPYGYTLTLYAYTPVFAYMIKNESIYANELADALNSPKEQSATTTPFIFSDLTVSNQTMRVGVSGSSTVIYAFVNAQTLIMSSSTESILTLRNAILSQ